MSRRTAADTIALMAAKRSPPSDGTPALSVSVDVPTVDPSAPVPAAAGDGVTEEIARRVARATVRWELTPRQAEVLREIARGHANRRIAEALRCAESTIEIHMTALLSKTGCESRAELVAKFWIELA